MPMKELLWEAARGFAEGLAAGGRGHDASAIARVERLFREIGWGAQESHGDGLCFHFEDSVVSIRKLHVVVGDTGHFALLVVPSAVTIPVRRIDPTIPAYLLLRNAELTAGLWQASDGGGATFSLKYVALIEGLDAATLQIVVRAMLAEAQDFDTKMRSSGLL